jgi:hypothetical protein
MTQPPPVTPQYQTPTRTDLRTIAMQQRVILICILIYIMAVIGQFILPPKIMLLVGLGALGADLVAVVFVFMLAIRLYNVALGIVLGILTLIPLVGLIVLLVVNGKATTILRQNGLKVGLLGATVP